MAEELVTITPGMKICFNPAWAERHAILIGVEKDGKLTMAVDYSSPTYDQDWLYLQVVKTNHLPDIKKLAMVCKVFEKDIGESSEIVLVYPEDIDIAEAFNYKPLQ